jgi:hypothetical protein
MATPNQQPERVALYFTLPESQLERLEIDAVLTEQHSVTGEVTQFPIEGGARISDHVLLQPERLRLDGVVSNTPLPSAPRVGAAKYRDYASAVNDAQHNEDLVQLEDPFSQRGEEVYWKLKRIRDGIIPIAIRTAFRGYTDMILLTLEVPRDANIGDSFRFMAEFCHVVQVDTQIVAVPRADKPGKVSLGKQATTKMDPKVAESSNSFLRGVKQTVKQFFAK